MGWLFALFGIGDPPTEKQLRFAAMLGIQVTKWMSKDDVSLEIDKKKAQDPSAYGKACGRTARAYRRADAVVSKLDGDEGDLGKSEKEFLKTAEGRAVVAEFKKWTRVCDAEPYGILVYRVPKTSRVETDVARLAGADVNHDANGNLRVVLDVTLPEITGSDGFQQLAWSKSLGWFPSSGVLLWQRLPASFIDEDGCLIGDDAEAQDRRQARRYEEAIEKGKRLVREKRLR